MATLDRVSQWGLPTRVAIDTQIVDLIADTAGALDAIQRAGSAGRLIIVTSHIIRDQLAATPNPTRRDMLLNTYDALPAQDVPTHGVVLDVSKFDEARFEDEQETGISLSEVTTRGRGGIHDALIATTASGEAAGLVTEDRELRRRIESSTARCAVWSFGDLMEFVNGEGA
jgi:hypothetical protein